MITNEIVIRSGQGDYSVKFLKNINTLIKSLEQKEEDYFLICDENIWNIYGTILSQIPTKRKMYVWESLNFILKLRIFLRRY